MRSKTLLRKSLYSIIILCILASTFIGISMTIDNSQRNDLNHTNRDLNEDYIEDNKKLKRSQTTPIRLESITQNDSLVVRVLESINFTVNITDFIAEGGNLTVIVFQFSRNEIGDTITKEDNMTQIGNSNNYTYTYRPEYNDTLGLVDVRFRIYNATGPKSGWELQRLNGVTTTVNFTIISNSMVRSDKIEYERSEPNQILFANLIINNSDDFTWKISVSNDTNIYKENILFGVGSNIYYIIFGINTSFVPDNSYYYIKVNLTHTPTGKKFAEYFYFKVLSPETLILSSSIDFTPDQPYRTQACSVFVNVTYIQNNLSIGNARVKLTLTNTNGANIFSRDLTNNNDGSFVLSFVVDKTQPAGRYRYTLIAYYNDENFDEYTNFITILNNPPVIDAYEINDYDTDERISVLYGEDLEFEFDVIDIEGVAYITLLLINEDDDEYEITREYDDDLEIIIRTEDLITGTWDIYVSVTDTDGLTVELGDNFDEAPQKFTILPDTLSGIFPWITLVIGLILGAIVSLGIGNYLRKPKYKPEVEKELIPKKVRPEKRPKPEKIRPTPTERVPVKEIIEEKPEKEKERRKITPPRKIKRRLK